MARHVITYQGIRRDAIEMSWNDKTRDVKKVNRNDNVCKGMTRDVKKVNRNDNVCKGMTRNAVSYTHLTLPTILLV